MDKFKQYRKLLDKVLFIGGNPRLASTRIRTIQIAQYLGCDFTINDYLDEKILEGKEIFILNKAFTVDRDMLRKRGIVIVDIIDPVGIPDAVDGYIFSSYFAQKNVILNKPSFVIHQHHMNFSNIPNKLKKNPTEVYFIGETHWYPEGLLPPHKAFLNMNGDNDKETEENIIKKYRESDVLLNFRNLNMNPDYINRHLVLNGGMKVINAMAYGIPSISSNEPVLHEVGEGCTIFSTFDKCEEDLNILLNDKKLYSSIRKKCLDRAEDFSIENISKKFIEMFLFFYEMDDCDKNKIGFVMPNQFEAFNGDFYVREEFLKLKKKFSINKVVETGTCLGSTTLWLSQNFDEVDTIEINPIFMEYANNRFKNNENIKTYLGDSGIVLKEILNKKYDKSIIFLDAHFTEENFPLEKELNSIIKAKIKPVIVIHDFFVPGQNKLGYDTWNKKKLEFKLVEKYLNKIYGKDKFEYYYNSNEKSVGAKRGLIYIHPK